MNLTQQKSMEVFYIMTTINGSIRFVNVFIANSAGQYAGVFALYFGTNLNVEYCNFARNHAPQYGGFIILQEASVNFFNSYFDSSSAGLRGGVLDAFASTVTINYCQFTNSGSGNYGGVVTVTLNCSLMILNSIFSYNAVQMYGGAVAINYNSNGTLINNLFHQNVGTLRWSYIYYSKLHSHCHVVHLQP